jgi:hypothetical protein
MVPAVIQRDLVGKKRTEREGGGREREREREGENHASP